MPPGSGGKGPLQVLCKEVMKGAQAETADRLFEGSERLVPGGGGRQRYSSSGLDPSRRQNRSRNHQNLPFSVVPLIRDELRNFIKTISQ